jgi:hypothetical protein
MLLWFYDSSGYFTGTSSTLANGASAGAYVCSDVKTSNLNFAPTVELQIQGGDRIRATPTFGNPRLVPFDVTISALDAALSDYINSSTRNSANSTNLKVGYNPNRAAPVNMGCALQQRMDMTDGTTRWNTLIIPKAQVLFRRGNYAFRGESDATAHIAPITSTSSYDGRLYDSTGLAFGWEENKGDYYELWTSNPVHIMAQRSDATATTFTTTYTPVSSTITINASSNEMVKNGTVTALSSLVTATKVATLAAAGTAGDMHILTYETLYN